MNQRVPFSFGPRARPVRQMVAESAIEEAAAAPHPVPAKAVRESRAAKTGQPPSAPASQKKPSARKAERQKLQRVSAELGTTRSSGGDPGVKLIDPSMRERLLAVVHAPRRIRQAEAYVSDWHPSEKVLTEGREIEVVRGRTRSAGRPLPRAPESRWNLSMAESLDTPAGTEAADPRAEKRFAHYFSEVSEVCEDSRVTHEAIGASRHVARHEVSGKGWRVRVIPDDHGLLTGFASSFALLGEGETFHASEGADEHAFVRPGLRAVA